MKGWKLGLVGLMACALGVEATAQARADLHETAQRIDAARHAKSAGLDQRLALARVVADTERLLQRCAFADADAHWQQMGPQIDALEQALAQLVPPVGDARLEAIDQTVRTEVIDLVAELRSLQSISDTSERRSRASALLEDKVLTGGARRTIRQRPPPNWQTLPPRTEE